MKSISTVLELHLSSYFWRFFLVVRYVFYLLILDQIQAIHSQGVLKFTAAADQYTIERTDFFRCTDGEFNPSKDAVYLSFPGMERVQNHCIDYSEGQPVFVRGTYLMVEIHRVCFLFRLDLTYIPQQMGYFEGKIDAKSRTANYEW